MYYEIDLIFNHKGEYKGLILEGDEIFKVEIQGRLLQDWYAAQTIIRSDLFERGASKYTLYISDSFVEYMWDNATNTDFKYTFFRLNKKEELIEITGEKLYKNLKNCFFGFKAWKTFDDVLAFLDSKKLKYTNVVGCHKSDVRKDLDN